MLSMYIIIKFDRPDLTAGRAYQAEPVNVLGVACYLVVDNAGARRYVEPWNVAGTRE